MLRFTDEHCSLQKKISLVVLIPQSAVSSSYSIINITTPDVLCGFPLVKCQSCKLPAPFCLFQWFAAAGKQQVLRGSPLL